MAIDQLLRDRLRGIAGLAIRDDEQARSSAEKDFGGLGRGSVHAVARPVDAGALAALVALANDEGLSLTPRGLGLSQSGQSVPSDGLSVDTGAFGHIEIDRDAGIARCGAAVTWRQLLAAASAHGLAPEVMPLNSDLSIGGTLSAGGMGSTSHRYGMAVCAVESLTAVTGAGELVAATRERRRDVYDAVLGGAGHFGFICSVDLRLRALRPRTRTFFLLYDDVATLLADELRLIGAPWCTHLEGFASAAVQGLRRGPAGRRSPFARWFYGLHLSAEFADADEPDEAACLRGLGHRELLHVEDNDSVEFAARYDLRFEMMRATGAWQQIHPWLECMLPHDAAAELLAELVPRLPLMLGDGHRIMPVADVPHPELVVLPAGMPAIGFAVLPVGIPPAFEAPALTALRDAHARLVAAGGKRYVSGWLFEPDMDAWRTHFGERFERWRARKSELDPRGVLRSVLFPGAR
jgi:cytokinin dehydrogenase